MIIGTRFGEFTVTLCSSLQKRGGTLPSFDSQLDQAIVVVVLVNFVSFPITPFGSMLFVSPTKAISSEQNIRFVLVVSVHSLGQGVGTSKCILKCQARLPLSPLCSLAPASEKKK